MMKLNEILHPHAIVEECDPLQWLAHYISPRPFSLLLPHPSQRKEHDVLIDYDVQGYDVVT
jgi:hypothetical protein